MDLRRLVRSCAPAIVGVWGVCLLFGSGCVEPFGGSNIQFTLAGGVHIPGTPADFGRPPPGTHYQFYATQTRELEDGRTIEFTFKVAEFEVLPLISRASPCFIEDDESRFPGLHSTQFAQKLREETGIDDPFNPPAGADDGDIIDIITADVRMNNLGRLEGGVKAVTNHSPASYPTGIPDPTNRSDAANAERRERCNAFWDANPTFYEGSDKVFTLPLNAAWLGAVDGADPRTSAFLGGVSLFVDSDLSQIDGLMINYQYDCTPADFRNPDIGPDACEPQYPDGFPDDDKSDIGFHYMSGEAVDRTRGVINVPMSNRLFGQISGEAAIWFDLDHDDVQF
jgi:hypothetical protein